jgi:hypothetical protein
MSMLQITLSGLSLSLSIWLYMLIWGKHLPQMNISQLQQCWQCRKHHPVIVIFNGIFRKISAMFKWIFRIIKKMGSLLKELFAEIIVQLIFRSIFNIFKAIFHLIIRIFD